MPNTSKLFMPQIETRIIKTSETPISVQPAPSKGKRFAIGLLKFVLYIIFVAVAVYYTPKILAKALHTPYPLATITSGSMWPVLHVNDLILMKGITGDQAQIGQIIVYQNSRGFTIHRLIKKENGMLVTQGDANDVEDAPITPSQVVGRVVYIGSTPFHIPYLGAIARSLGPTVKEMEDKG